MVITYRSLQSSSSSSLEGQLTSPLHRWTDFDSAGRDVDSSCSTSGMFFMFPCVAISWKTKKQTTVALSSTKVEYMSTTLATKEGLQLKSILKEVDVKKLLHTKMQCDNQSCIKITINPKLTEQNKHIKAKHHFIRHLIEIKELELQYTSKITMWADFLSKPVPHQNNGNVVQSQHLSLTTTQEVFRIESI